ncbi:MAG: methyltransferase family protein [Betaproteobacteria bacterium]
MPNALQRLQPHVPTILFSLSAILWIVLAYYKLVDWSGPLQTAGIAVMVIYILWLTLESKVSTAESGKGHTEKDHGTLELYAIGRICTVTVALALPTLWTELNAVAVVGLVLFVAGILWRLQAIRTLGKFYSHRVRQVSGHRIVNTGPYRFMRHPAYTGMLVSHLGFVLFFFNYYALALLVVFFIPTVVTRILVEEKMLFEMDGYKEFAAGRARLMPFVW